MPEYVAVRTGGGRGESDSQQHSIPGRKDKNLHSQCQHSMAQRDFIDQRTAMPEPLLHPSDTIYHAPRFLPPSLCSFHCTSIQSSPSCKNRHTHTQKNFLKTKLILLQMIGGLNQSHSNKIQQMNTHPKTPQATSWDLEVRTGINLIETGFLDDPLITLPIPHWLVVLI